MKNSQFDGGSYKVGLAVGSFYFKPTSLSLHLLCKLYIYLVFIYQDKRNDIKEY